MRARATREKEREEEEAACLFKLWPTVSTGVIRLSRAGCSGMTGGHVAQGGWTASPATEVGVTQSHQTTRRDSSLRGAMSMDAPQATQCTWCNSFISHANQNATTENG
jgi:hypothetical protein